MFARATLSLLLLLPWTATGQLTVAQTYVVDSEQSWLRVLVYRAGLMSRLGHNHIVSIHDIDGTVEYTGRLSDTAVELYFPVATMVVDDSNLRNHEGEDFPGQVSEKDIRGTRRNMLGRKVLDAENFAEIRIQAKEISGSLDALTVIADVIVKGQTNTITFPAHVDQSEQQLMISGTAQVSHKDLGLKPFSAEAV